MTPNLTTCDINFPLERAHASLFTELAQQVIHREALLRLRRWSRTSAVRLTLIAVLVVVATALAALALLVRMVGAPLALTLLTRCLKAIR
jgi:hypothetical protein